MLSPGQQGYTYILLQPTTVQRGLSIHIGYEAVHSHQSRTNYHQSINIGSVLLPLPLNPSLLSPSLTQSTAGGRYTGVARLWYAPNSSLLCSGCPASVKDGVSDATYKGICPGTALKIQRTTSKGTTSQRKHTFHAPTLESPRSSTIETMRPKQAPIPPSYHKNPSVSTLLN